MDLNEAAVLVKVIQAGGFSAAARLLGVPTSTVSTRVARLEKRLGVLRELLAAASRGRIDFDEAFGKEDRLTQAVTIFALLEMYKKGEATWTQRETFGAIEIARGPAKGSEVPV